MTSPRHQAQAGGEEKHQWRGGICDLLSHTLHGTHLGEKLPKGCTVTPCAVAAGGGGGRMGTAGVRDGGSEVSAGWWSPQFRGQIIP